MKTLRKYHKWPSLIIGFFLMLFCVSGIVMNHRQWFASANFPRKLMPPVYHYKNWNLASVKGSVQISDSAQLVFGNIGIWQTDNNFSTFSDFNAGIGSGIDQRKIFTLLQSGSGQLYAGSLFGLYQFNQQKYKWEFVYLPESEPRVVRLLQDGSRIWVMTRSHLFYFDEGEQEPEIKEMSIPIPAGMDGKTGLFRTLWVIHSGELFGLTGKILVDLVGMALLFITLTGFYYTFMPSLAKRSQSALKKKLKRLNRFSIKWHNKIGVYGLVFLVITTLSGMFLRPPLLIPIANSRVNPIPGTLLAHENVWHDKLRDMVLDTTQNRMIISSSEGFWQMPVGSAPQECTSFAIQPPVSVMGINVFDPMPEGGFLIGSFSGLYRWFPERNVVIDAISGLPVENSAPGNPFGSLAVAGVINQVGEPIAMLDYEAGWIPLKKGSLQPKMPDEVRQLPISLWNLSLEVHTGRIFSVFLGDFYILYVPLMGLTTLLILITGFIIWYKTRKRKKKQSNNGESQHEDYQISAGTKSAV